MRRRIRPYLADVFLGRLTAAEVASLYGKLSGEGLSPRTVRQAHEVLHNALEHALELGLIEANPASARWVKRSLPKKEQKERRTVPPEKVPAFLDAAAMNELGAYFVLLLFGGLRPEEGLALRWSDFDGRSVRINRVLVDADDLELHYEAPKTEKSRRAVALPSSAVEFLREHRKAQAARQLKAGPAWEDEDLIFTNDTGGPLQQEQTRGPWSRLRKAAKLGKMRVYDLRHSCATLLLAAGESPKVVAERLGHSTTVLTMDTYSHVIEGMQKSAADKLERLAAAEGG